MKNTELENMVGAEREKREKKKRLALELVRTAAEQDVSVNDFIEVLRLAERIAMRGKLNPPD